MHTLVAQRPHGALLQRLAGPGVADAQGRAGRPRGVAAQPRDRDAPGLRLRQGQPGDPRQEHHRARPGHPDPGQAAGRARRDPARRAAGAQQPGPDLQPAGRHPRHPRQHRRARPPDPVRPGHLPLRHPRPGEPGRPGVQRRPADPRQEPARGAHRATPAPTSYDRMDPTPRRTRGGAADDPPAEGPRRPGRRRAAADRLLVRRLPAAPAGRPRRRQRPDHRDGPVPRRARPGARLHGQGQRRHGRQDHRHLARGLHRRR